MSTSVLQVSTSSFKCLQVPFQLPLNFGEVLNTILSKPNPLLLLSQHHVYSLWSQQVASAAVLPRGDLSRRGHSPGLQQEKARVAGLPRGALPGRQLSLSLQQWQEQLVYHEVPGVGGNRFSKVAQ